MHGPHQSDPEKLIRINLFDSFAIFAVSLKLPDQIAGGVINPINTKNINFIRLFLFGSC
jgi:hypothetical protein